MSRPDHLLDPRSDLPLSIFLENKTETCPASNPIVISGLKIYLGIVDILITSSFPIQDNAGSLFVIFLDDVKIKFKSGRDVYVDVGRLGDGTWFFFCCCCC